MTLKSKTQQALAGMGAFHGGRQRIDLADGPLVLAIELVALETLGCAFERFELSTPKLHGKTTGELKAIAEALSAKLTYLLEPISPIEVDHEQCIVQMRSNPPLKGDDGTTYYELLVARSGLSLGRYRKDTATQRTPIAAQVTREVLLRLVEDFAGAVG